MSRLIDYGLVLIVILLIMGLFRFSRYLLDCFLASIRKKGKRISSDSTLYTGMIFLLSGLLFLPFFTSLLAFVRRDFLSGGMVLHLVLVSISVIVFSIAEDLFRIYRNFPADSEKGRWSVSEHFRKLSLPLMVFWIIGCVFISPLFYSGLSLVLSLFYLYAVGVCRNIPEKRKIDVRKK